MIGTAGDSVYDLPPKTHVGFTIRSKVNQILASQINGSLDEIADDFMLTDEQRVQFQQLSLTSTHRSPLLPTRQNTAHPRLLKN